MSQDTPETGGGLKEPPTGIAGMNSLYCFRTSIGVATLNLRVLSPVFSAHIL